MLTMSSILNIIIDKYYSLPDEYAVFETTGVSVVVVAVVVVVVVVVTSQLSYASGDSKSI